MQMRYVTTQLTLMRLRKTGNSIVDLFIHSGFGGNKPSTVVDLFGSTPEIIHQGGRGGVHIIKKRNPKGAFQII